MRKSNINNSSLSYCMEALIFISIPLSVIISVVIGKRGALFLPTYSRFFNRKPFCCRPCLTFWLSVLQFALIAFKANSLATGLTGLVISFVLFAIVWNIDNNKIID